MDEAEVFLDPVPPRSDEEKGDAAGIDRRVDDSGGLAQRIFKWRSYLVIILTPILLAPIPGSIPTTVSISRTFLSCLGSRTEISEASHLTAAKQLQRSLISSRSKLRRVANRLKPDVGGALVPRR